MITNFVFRHHVSLGALDGHPGFGRGFNAVMDVTAGEKASEAIRAWVSHLDHRHLGLDLDLGFAPTLDKLAESLLRAVPEATKVEISRGDGVSCSRRR